MQPLHILLTELCYPFICMWTIEIARFWPESPFKSQILQQKYTVIINIVYLGRHFKYLS